jgi:hypothetical protein
MVAPWIKRRRAIAAAEKKSVKTASPKDTKVVIPKVAPPAAPKVVEEPTVAKPVVTKTPVRKGTKTTKKG